MNDPHVEALLYHVKHPKNVDYAKAAPLEHESPAFRLRVKPGEVRIELMEHHASVDAARATVEPFLRAWEMSAALQYGPGEMIFSYNRAEVIDRNPTPGTIHLSGSSISVSVMMGTPTIHVSRGKYPEPPVGIARDAVVDLMFQRYCLYREQRTTLPDATYYCLTVLEGSAGNRRTAAEHFSIAFPVLDKLGELAAKKGGKEARKFDGSQVEFTHAERQWLEKALPMLIKRAGERAFNVTAYLPQVTMADLPPLPSSALSG